MIELNYFNMGESSNSAWNILSTDKFIIKMRIMILDRKLVQGRDPPCFMPSGGAVLFESVKESKMAAKGPELSSELLVLRNPSPPVLYYVPPWLLPGEPWPA